MINYMSQEIEKRKRKGDSNEFNYINFIKKKSKRQFNIYFKKQAILLDEIEDFKLKIKKLQIISSKTFDKEARVIQKQLKISMYNPEYKFCCNIMDIHFNNI